MIQLLVAAAYIAASHLKPAEAYATPSGISIPILAGCGKSLPKGQAIGTVSNVTITSSGIERSYLISIPPSYNAYLPTSIILSYHGGTRTAEDQLKLDQLTNPEFNTEHLVVYPQGINKSWQGVPGVTINDVQFTTDILNEVEKLYCINPSRITATGKSDGAGFCNVLACDSTLSKRIAAFAPVSGAYYINTLPCDSSAVQIPCSPGRKDIPILAFHGGNDTTIAYNGGERKSECLPSIPHFIQEWAIRDGLGSNNITTPVATDAVAYHFGHGLQAGLVELIYESNIGHDWPSTVPNPDNTENNSHIANVLYTAEMEPRFSLSASTPRSSKRELVIGGIKVYIYGLDELKQTSDVEVAVLYLAHMRTRTYLVTEAIAHEVLHRYRTDGRKKRVGLIAITMDMRNHGDRIVSPQANLTWKDGNEDHATDLLAVISGSAQDFKLVLDYLPAYLPQFTGFHNIMAGISLGGHMAYRIASLAPGQFEGFAIVVGCPTLASLLLSRLGIDALALGTTVAELGSVSYDKLEKIMNKQQKRRWPRAIAELIGDGDKTVYEEFPPNVPLLMCNGKQDPLVPASYTASWLKKRRANKESRQKEENIKFFVQENTGHSCTKEMVALIAAWLGNIFECRDVEFTSVLTESRL
ncbi:hypothetical protein B7463_g7842, partial [Scytalidium lignicola]